MKKEIERLIEEISTNEAPASNDSSLANGLPGDKENFLDSAEAYDELRQKQDLRFRERILKSIDAGREARQKTRQKVLACYIVYMALVTAGIFWVIIDPLDKGYSVEIQKLLIGTLMVNLISLAFVIIRYAFSTDVEKQLIQLFNQTGRNKLHK